MKSQYKNNKGLVLFQLLTLFIPFVPLRAQNIPVLTETAPSGTATGMTVTDPIPNPGTGYNYYRTFTPLLGLTNPNDVTENSLPENVQITTTFKDGFNRPIEKVYKNFTSNTKAHLTIPYDTRNNSGASYQFLPYARDVDVSAINDPNSHYTHYTLTYQKDYYTNAYPGEGYTSYQAIKNVSDANSRKSITYLPGKSQVGQQRGIVSTKVTNDANTIRMWAVGNSTSNQVEVTNFNNGIWPGWSNYGNTTLSVENQELKVALTGQWKGIRRDFNVIPGRQYKVLVDLDMGTIGQGISLTLVNTSSWTPITAGVINQTTNGVNMTFTPTTSTVSLVIETNWNAPAGYFYIDNYVLEDITPTGNNYLQVEATNFSSGTQGWQNYNGIGTGSVQITNDNGRLKISNDNRWQGAQRPLAVTAGKQYRFTIDIDKGNLTNTVQLSVLNANPNGGWGGWDYLFTNNLSQSINGYSVTFTAPSSNMKIVIENDGNHQPQNYNWYLDNYKLEEIQQGGGSSNTAVSSAYYAANELFGVETIGQDNEKIISYNDKDGNLVYKKQLISSNPLVYAETYYVYDELGNLRYVLPPKAVEAIGSGTTIPLLVLNNLCFQYEYDHKGRESAIKNPGEDGKTYVVYDHFGRLVMKQDAVQKLAGKWEVTFYDKMGRAIATSLYQSNNDRNYWQEIMDNSPANPASSTLEYFLTTAAGEGQYPGENSIANNQMLTYSYYDDYSNTLDANGNIFNLVELEHLFLNDQVNTTGAETPVRSLRTHGLLTGKKIRILKSDNAQQGIGDWRHSVYYYDDKGRTIVAATFDKMSNQGQTDFQHAQYLSNQYNFIGQLLVSKHTVKNNLSADGNNLHVELIKNEYESATALLKKTSHKINNGPWSIIAMYQYDELGRVKRQVLGNYGEVQDLNYNIRGQVTGINAIYAETGDKQNESRSFGQSIKYDYGFTNVRKDGKISGTVWRGGGSNPMAMAYGYIYDEAGRLKNADFKEMALGGWSNANIDFTVSNLKYDIGGNLTSMKQRGMAYENGGMVPKDIDRLQYTYDDNSHKLMRVEDTVTVDYGIGDFVNSNNNGSADYKYDVNGNLAGDKNKGIQDIFYNHLNKPVKIQFTNGNKIEYSYDALGRKMEEVLIPQTGTPVRTDYVGNLVYKNDSLQYLLTEKGRAVYNPTNVSFTEEFFVKDYWGNIRSVVDVVSIPMIEYLASYELASAYVENLFFETVDEVRDEKPGSTNMSDTKSARLNGAEADRRIGTSLLLKVMAGDRVEFNVNNFYESYNQNEDNPVVPEEMLNSIVGTLMSGPGGFQGSESHDVNMVGKLFSPSNYLNNFNSIVNQSTDPTKPKAYLNYVMFDERYQIIPGQSGAFQVNGDGTWTTIGTNQPIEIPQNGFIGIYIDNRSITDVFFDQLVVRFTKGRLKEENHYYPYGLPMGNMGSMAMGFKQNKYRYQGNENNKEMGLHLMDFHFRQYDAQIGRFTGVDPLAANLDMVSPFASMNNDPVQYIDPFGLEPDGGFKSGRGSSENTFGLPEITITGKGPGKSKPSPGGGNNPIASYGNSGPSGVGGWDRGASGILDGTPSGGAGGVSGGSGAKSSQDNVPIDNHGSPAGADNGVEGGVVGGTNPKGEGYVSNTTGGEEGGSPDGSPNGISSSVLNVIHNVLDVAGYVPVVGEVFDGINSLIYLREGDYTNAALSAASAIPFIGYAASSVKAANKIIKASKSELKAIKSLEKQIIKHEKKLDDFLKDPFKYDNKDFLKNAPSDEIRDRIIKKRVDHLQKEIQTFKDNIDKILEGL